MSIEPQNRRPLIKGSAIKPQLALRIDKIEDLDLPLDRYVMQIKYDGWRCIAIIGAAHVTFLSRQGNSLPSFSMVEEELIESFPAGTILDGEFTATDRATLGGLMNSNTGLTDPIRAGALGLRYRVFDVLQFDGHDARGVDLTTRYKLIDGCLPDALRFVSPVKNFEVTQGLYEVFVGCNPRHEGVVIKRKDGRYRNGERKDWFKLKPLQSDELLVDKIEEVDDVGRIFFNTEGNKVYSPTEGAKSVQVGDLIEVQHDGITKAGRFTNPRFLRIREDL